MKKIWKWILGILIGLLVVAVIAAAAFLIAGRWSGFRPMIAARAAQRWDDERSLPQPLNPRQVPPDQDQWRREMPRGYMPMYPYGRMMRRPYMGFFPFGGVLGGLICLGFLGLLVIGGIFLVRSVRRPQQPVVTQASPAVTPLVAEAAQPSVLQTCPSCSRQVQEDWVHCPYCGTALRDVPEDAPEA